VQTIVNLVLSERCILIEQRFDTFFNWQLPWPYYKAAFGTNSSDYWFGLENMHQLTTSGSYQLRVEYQQRSTGQWFVDEYSSFAVDDEASKYRLNVAGHSGNGTNVLDGPHCQPVGSHNGMKFSTYDQDNDLASNQCAPRRAGGWWFNKCFCFCPTCYATRGYALRVGDLQASRMLIKPL
jgi:ficolin